MDKKKKKTDQKGKSDPMINQGRLEAVLFAAAEPVCREKLRKVLKLQKKEFSDLLAEMTEKYQKETSGLQLLEKNGKIQLVSKFEYGSLVSKFLGLMAGEDLSKVVLETLAIIAYRGPITKAQIEYIRGVNCNFPLRTLLLRGLIERKENPLDSRAYLYEISFEFMQKMGLKSLEELPEYDELSRKEEIEDKPPQNNQ